MKYGVEECALDVGTLLPLALRKLQSQNMLTKCCLCGADHRVGEGLFLCLGSQPDGGEPDLHVHPVCGTCGAETATVEQRVNRAMAERGRAFFSHGSYISIPADQPARVSLVTAMQRAALEALRSAPGYTCTEPVVMRVLELDRKRAGETADTRHYGLLYRGGREGTFVPFAWADTDGYLVRGRPAREAAVLSKALQNGTAEVDLVGRGKVICTATTRVMEDLARV